MKPIVPMTLRSRRARACMSVLLFLSLGGLACNASAQLFDSFDPNANNAVNTVAVQADGKILVGGAFNAIGGWGYTRLARLHADGRVDTAFRTVAVNGAVNSIVPLPDGKTIIAGNFSLVVPPGFPVGVGFGVLGIARLDANGFWDPTFNVAPVPNGGAGNVFRVLRLANGQLLIGGHFTSVSGVARAKLARLNSNGSVDTTFNAGSMNGNDYVWTLAEQADGKIVVGGGFNFMGGLQRPNIARLNVNGSADTSFPATVASSTGAYPSVSAVLVQPDGNIVIAGQFDRVNGSTRRNLARLTTNGSLDSAYFSNAGTNGPIHAALLQPNGRVLIGGGFSSVSEGGQLSYWISASKVARLDASGHVDPTFALTGATNGDVYAMVRQADGKTVLGGSFTSIDSQQRNRLARLNGTFASVTQGPYHSCGLTPHRTVECWGLNNYGQLGDGTTTNRGAPVPVVGPFHADSVSVGWYHTCTLNRGRMACWGRNDYGQLGDGTTMNRSTPVPVDMSYMIYLPNLLSAGGYHTCAGLSSHGFLNCWGSNMYGQLADGPPGGYLTSPMGLVEVPGLSWITTGEFRTCAYSWTMSCWGTPN
jgi:uncharacterized delta-60 repeat protein